MFVSSWTIMASTKRCGCIVYVAIDSYAYVQVIETFRRNKIRGKALLLLTDEDLEQLGLVALGDKKCLRQLINEVRIYQ